MNGGPRGKSVAPGDHARPLRFHKRDFWGIENLKFSRPGIRLEKSSRIIRELARGKDCALLDVGCGPAALKMLLPDNVRYYGIDIAIHCPAPNLKESDLLQDAIRFGDKRFDIVIASGLFEYMGDQQDEKFGEIAQILNRDGHFIVSYMNFSHQHSDAYWAVNNVQSLWEFRAALARHFNIDRCVPVGHNWRDHEPGRPLIKAANMYVNWDIPIVSRKFAVEYLFICSV